MQRGQSLVKNSTTIMEKADYHSVVCFFFRSFSWLEPLHRAQPHAAAVNWRSRRRCLWQIKAAGAHGRHPHFSRADSPDEKYAGANEKSRLARQGNPGHRKSRLDVRRISAARAAFSDIQQILYTQKVSLQESFSRLRGCCKFFSYMLYSMQSKAVLNFLMEIYYE